METTHWWEVDKGFSEVVCIRVISRTKIGGYDEVNVGMQKCFVLTVIKCPLVGGEEGQNGSGIRAGQYGEPVN